MGKGGPVGMEKMSHNQEEALSFARQVVADRDTRKALTAHNRLDNAFANWESREVDRLMASLRVLNAADTQNVLGFGERNPGRAKAYFRVADSLRARVGREV
jgi:hypothetical protein